MDVRRAWMITLFADGVPGDEFAMMSVRRGSRAGVLRYVCWNSDHAPSTGRLHWHILMILRDPMTRAEVMQLLPGLEGAHFQNIRKNVYACREYVLDGRPETFREVGSLQRDVRHNFPHGFPYSRRPPVQGWSVPHGR